MEFIGSNLHVVDNRENVGSTTSRVFRTLRQSILTGKIGPGERLKVDDLRQLLDVGASPIREALSLLTSAHLVERLDQRGFRVADVSQAEFEELLKTRCWLEERALRESIASAGADWEERLVLAHHRLGRVARDQNDRLIAQDEWELRHREFHQALISGCGSSILIRICDELYDHNIRYRHLAGHQPDYKKRDVTAEHAEIAQAALDRNADATVTKLLSHYQRTGQFLGKQFS